MLRQVRVAIRVVVAAALVITSACKKDEGRPTPSPAAEQSSFVQRPAAVDPAKLSAPALFEHVPVDTPYMFGSFEGFPFDRAAKLFDALAPLWDEIEAGLELLGDEQTIRVVASIKEELGGRWSADGLKKLGFDPSARFAVYGLGVQGIVARVELKDPQAVLDAIDRIASRAQLTLPARETRDGREFWRIVEDDAEIVIAFADHQAVFATGEAEKIQSSLGLILGTEKPKANMAGGKALVDVAVKHGFGPHMIGFFDGARILEHVFALPDLSAPPACKPAVERLVQQIPRVVLGYGPLDGNVWSGGLVVELAPDLVADVKALKVDIPGLADVMNDRSLFSMGMGADLERGRQLVQRAIGSLQGIMDACGDDEAAEDLARAADQVAAPLPPPAASITGLAFAIDQLSFAGSPVPDKVDAVAFVTSKDGKALFSQLEKLLPLGQLGVSADGKLHAISGLPIPIATRAGVGDHAIVVAAGGDSSTQLAEKILAARPAGNAPLVVASFDYPRFLEIQHQLQSMMIGADPLAELQHELEAAYGKLFGRGEGSLDVNEHGVVLWMSQELK